MVKAVIFDLDDTLVKTYVIKWQQHKAVARDFYGRDVNETELREHWGKPFDALIAALLRDADTVENMRRAYASTADRFPKEIHDDTLEVIDSLHNRGIEIGIVTATNREFLLRDLKRLNVPIEKFFCLQAADETAFHKPDPRVFDPILEKLSARGIDESDVVYVGDALTDFHAARDAGLAFVAVTTGLHSAEEFKSEGVPHVIDRIGLVPDILQKLSP